MSDPPFEPPSLEPNVGESSPSETGSPNAPDSNIMPSNLQFKIGHILDGDEEYLVHQYACAGIELDPLGHEIATAYPLANPYATRQPDPSTPHRCLRYQDTSAGHIQVFPRESDEHHRVVGFFAQYDAGPPRRNLSPETVDMRIFWFKICLEKLQKVPGLDSVAFPGGIGCGMAGGDWRDYGAMIKEFAENNRGIEVAVYWKEGSEDSDSMDDGEDDVEERDGDEESRKRKREESKEASEGGSPMEVN
jgi:hypothetical protein